MSQIKDFCKLNPKKEKIEGLIEIGISYGKPFADSTVFYRDSLRTDPFTISKLTGAGMFFSECDCDIIIQRNLR